MNRVQKSANVFFIIILAVVLRILPHMPNFAPITALALFGGVYFGKKYALLLPLIVMVLSDYLLLYINPFASPMISGTRIYPLNVLVHSTTIAVYGSFLISGCMGIWLRNHKSPGAIFAVSLFSSLQFFFITNAAVWIAGAYDRTIIGLWESYIAGLPFFRGTLFGDLFYTGVFFGGYAFIRKFVYKKTLQLA